VTPSYDITNSALFDGSTSKLTLPYLAGASRFSSLSLWVKRNKLGTVQGIAGG